MKFSIRHARNIFLAMVLLVQACTGPGSKLSPHLSLISGDINGAVLRSGTNRLVVYGDPAGNLSGADMVLFTHARRDVVWAGERLVSGGAKAIVPAGESDLFTRIDSFWNNFTSARFHDYDQQSTKWITKPLAVHRAVKGGDSLIWHGIPIRVIDSRGFTRGAVSYLVNIDGLEVAFVGDLIYGDGQILDLYSLQDRIPEANVRGYHGYAARISDLIASLERIAAFSPDMLVPVRGPVINDPEEAIESLISRLRQLYRNYLSVNAFRWYTGQERHNLMAARVLPQDMPVDWMDLAETGENPPWLFHHHNSKLIVSEDGTGFLIDCGLERVYKDMLEVGKQFPCSDIQGMFITHYHDDHTDFVNGISRQYGCPVYATRELEDVLKRPGAYRLPAMTSTPVDNLVVVENGTTMAWKEFSFTFYYLPGQTIYHDALLVEKTDGEKIFFAGDSFSPTGMDDYCLLNRNIIRPGMGYLFCLDLLRGLPAGTWIVNNHIEPPFRFSEEQLDLMTTRLQKRKTLMRELFPWDEPNYGLDERWARIHPYGQTLQPGRSASFSVIILNHSDRDHKYILRPATDEDGLTISPRELLIVVPSGEEGSAEFSVQASVDAVPGIRVQQVDIGFDGWNLHKWCESIIEVQVPS